MKLAKEIAEALGDIFFLVKRGAGIRTINEIDEATSIITQRLEPVRDLWYRVASVTGR